MSHTPGPWEIDGRSATLVIGANGRHIASTGSYHTDTHNSSGYIEENVANARLIAQSPAMYALLQRIANDIHDDVVDVGVWERDILQVLKQVQG